MASLIHELDNDALLLMYRADELSTEDRAEVEQMLAIDAGLRTALQWVERDAVAADAALAVADHVDPPAASPSAAGVALRKVGRAMRQWQVDRLVRARPAAAAAERQPRFPRWAYPAAAVAALVVGSISWWGMQTEPLPVAVGTGGGARSSHADPGGGMVDRTDDHDLNRDPALDPSAGAELPVLLALGPGRGDLQDRAERQARVLSRGDGSPEVPTIVADGLSE